jgi:transmembrane sensor
MSNQDDNVQNENWARVAKLLNGEADSAERKMVMDWVEARPENGEEFARLRDAWELASAESARESWNRPDARERLLMRLLEAQSKAGLTVKPGRAGKGKWLSLLKYAALFILIAGIPSLLVYHFTAGGGELPVSGRLTAISAARGSKTTMTLADGSRVWLNAGSTISYGPAFDRDSRDIRLTGEAYFEVAKDPSRPFNVSAGNVIVHAVGTAFNVKAYPDENVVETTLVEGKVEVEMKDGSAPVTVLKPREQVYYYKPVREKEKLGKVLISKGIEPEQFTSWVNDELVIDNETLGSLAVKLERKYDVNIYFDDPSLKELRFTGILRNETIEQVLDILRISSSLNYHMDKRDIRFMRK